MAIKTETFHVGITAPVVITLPIAYCDDCGEMLYAASTVEELHRLLLEKQAPDWAKDRPIFCPDQVACAERVWQRYGRYLQALIDEAPTLSIHAAVALQQSQPREQGA